MSLEFTDEQLKDFKRYEKVRQSGRYNMYDPGARAATGLGRDGYLFVMLNYSELKQAKEREG